MVRSLSEYLHAKNEGYPCISSNDIDDQNIHFNQQLVKQNFPR